MEDQDNVIAERNEMLAESVYNRHPEAVEVLESHSIKSAFGESVTPADIAALGHQIEKFEQLVAYTEATEGSLGSLGQIPLVGIDIITAVASQSIAPVIASIQTMEDEQGIIWFKNIQSGTTRHGVVEGQSVRKPHDAAGNLYDSDWLSAAANYSVANPLDGTTAGTLSQTLGLMADDLPVRPHTVRLELVDTTTNMIVGKLFDDGEGALLGNLAGGTIDYETGVLTVNFGSDPGDNLVFTGTIQSDFELKECLPAITTTTDSTVIKAEVQAAKIQYGKIQAMMMQKRGMGSVDQFAADVTNELTIMQNVRVVEQLVAAANASSAAVATFNLELPSGVSQSEHYLSFNSTIAEAEENLVAAAGMGQISFMVAGRVGVQFLRSLHQFRLIRAGVTGNVQVVGEWQGIPVIRATGGVAGVQPNEIYYGYKGNGIEAPVVVAPVLPLFMADVDGDLCNPLKNSKAAASMVGYKNVCPNLAGKIVLTVPTP